MSSKDVIDNMSVSTITGSKLISLHHSVCSNASTTGAAAEAQQQSQTPTAQLHLAFIAPHNGGTADRAGIPGVREMQVELTRGQVDVMLKQLERITQNI